MNFVCRNSIRPFSGYALLKREFGTKLKQAIKVGTDPTGTDPNARKVIGTDPKGTDPNAGKVIGTDPKGTDPNARKVVGTDPKGFAICTKNPEEQLINNLFKALRVKARAKMIMTETRGSEGYAQNYPANSARSKYSESPKKQKKALEAKDASQPAEQPLAMTPPPTLLTPNKVNKMIEECFPEIEKKRMGVPVFNSNAIESINVAPVTRTGQNQLSSS
ncbi:hypothetical protein CDL15_Pgr009399 [Punica granatum]|uniref:Uncharacterized protein n=1 Tax=Punica granatum TaxID=22663 RepID=A0A218VRK1_PUNGR|nr:hypothetical protein CDL15_Pgr009399 [Punica granatum]